MYFVDRIDAGKQLAALMKGNMPNVNRTIIALSDGAVVVGEQIAAAIHSSLLLLRVEEISLPGETNPMASVSSAGGLTYNKDYTASEIDEFSEEYNTYIEQARLQKIHLLNRESDEATIHPGLLRRHVIVLVSDGLNNGFLLDAAMDFLKPFKINRLIVATPFASVEAVDRMHLIGDQIFCLDIIQNYIDTNHYYENNNLPTHQDIVRNLKMVALHWYNPK